MDHPIDRGVAASARALAQGRWLAPFLVFGLVALVAACDSGEDGGATDATIAPETGALECETAGYPCALSDVPEEIFIRSDALAEEALDRIEAGATTDEAAAWLEEQDDMAELDWDDHAIRFRVDGGRDTWILRSSALGTRGAPSPADADTRSGGREAFDAPVPGTVERPARVADHVVGPDSPAKSALVLSPMLWDFRDLDDGRTVADLLEGTHGYEGRVRYEENTDTYDTDVDVEDFRGWGEYDVVHVASHGVRVCKKDQPGPCRATIAIKTIRYSPPESPEFLALPHEVGTARGLSLAYPEAPSGLGELCRGQAALDPNCTRVKFLLATADFFRNEYRGGLEDTVVWFNACESYGPEGTDLADVLRGSSSVYLGWTETVFSDIAYGAAVDLYTDLQKGFPLRTAYDRLGPVTVGVEGTSLSFGQRPAGGDLRIRDVVTLLDPDSGRPLPAGAPVTIRGELGDGEPDAMPYRVWVDGITDDVAGDVVLHLSVDGEETEPLPLDGSNAVDEARRELEGEFDLGEDLEEERAADVRAWIDLPFGGQSEQARRIQLVGPGPVSGRVWEVDIEYSGTPREPGLKVIQSSAHVIFELRPTSQIHPERVEYQLAGGTVTHDESHEDRLCIIEAPIVTAELTDEIAGGSTLRFDTTTDPWRVVLTVHIDLPDYTAMVACRPGTGEDAGPRREPEERPERGVVHLLGMTADKGLTIAPDATSVSGQDGEASFTLRRVE